MLVRADTSERETESLSVLRGPIGHESDLDDRYIKLCNNRGYVTLKGSIILKTLKNFRKIVSLISQYDLFTGFFKHIVGIYIRFNASSQLLSSGTI